MCLPCVFLAFIPPFSGWFEVPCGLCEPSPVIFWVDFFLLTAVSEFVRSGAAFSRIYQVQTKNNTGWRPSLLDWRPQLASHCWSRFPLQSEHSLGSLPTSAHSLIRSCRKSGSRNEAETKGYVRGTDRWLCATGAGGPVRIERDGRSSERRSASSAGPAVKREKGKKPVARSRFLLSWQVESVSTWAFRLSQALGGLGPTILTPTTWRPKTSERPVECRWIDNSWRWKKKTSSRGSHVSSWKKTLNPWWTMLFFAAIQHREH